MGPTGTHHADVADLGVQGGDDGRYVELVVMGQHAHRVALAQVLTDPLEQPMWPVDHHLVGRRKPAAGGKDLTSIADRHPVAEHLGHPDKRPGEVDCPKDQHLRRDGEGLDEHHDGLLPSLAVLAVVANPTATCGQFAPGVTNDHPVQPRITECSLEGRVGDSRGADHELGAGTRTLDNGHQSEGLLGVKEVPYPVKDRGGLCFASTHHRLPVERFDEQVDRAATGQPNCKGLVVAIAERHHATVALLKHL